MKPNLFFQAVGGERLIIRSLALGSGTNKQGFLHSFHNRGSGAREVLLEAPARLSATFLPLSMIPSLRSWAPLVMREACCMCCLCFLEALSDLHFLLTICCLRFLLHGVLRKFSFAFPAVTPEDAVNSSSGATEGFLRGPSHAT